MGKPIETGLFLASLGQFSDGMNSDVPPVALPSTQLSYAENCTVRGNFVTQRSAWRDSTLSFSGAQVQTGFEDGLFQGACYYKPDTGNETILCSVSGRFFSVTPIGNSASITEISAPTPNSAVSSIAWMWQAENFVIINDGQNAPAIYNGSETVRANQGETVATILTGGAFPNEGSSLSVTFTAPYSGPFNTPLYLYNPNDHLLGTVEVNSESSSSGYNVRLTNIDDPQGTTHDPNGGGTGGSKLWIINSWEGTSLTTMRIVPEGWDFGNPNNYDGKFVISVTPTCVAKVGQGFRWPDTVNGYGGETMTATLIEIISSTPTYSTTRWEMSNSRGVYGDLTVGDRIIPQNVTPDVLIATTTEDFDAPAIGQSVDVAVDDYSKIDAAVGQVVTIDGAHYTVSLVPPVTSATLYIKTLNAIEPGTTILTGATLRTIPQIPPGRMGVYGLGRNWVCLVDGQSYIATDIVGGSSGSIAYAFRDSMLFITENNFLAGGGVFRVPSAGQQINAMRFPATLDSSLGQGPLQVLTQDTTFSCNAPVIRAEWQDMVQPIQTQSLVGGGALSHNSCVAVNGDLWFRADDGIRSLKLARQDFQVSYANTPQSVEMNRVLLADDKSLLGYSSAVVFDNRLLMTASPVQSQGGVYHSKIIALNLDPNSNIRGKQPPVYDGAWNDRNVLQLVTGTFQNIKRCFAFTYDTDTSKIGLTEIQLTALPQSGTAVIDPDLAASGASQIDGYSAFNDNGTDSIEWMFESPAIFYQEDTRKRELLRLCDGEVFVRDLVGTVRFDVYYRPDYSSIWTPWHSWEVTDSPNFQPRMGLGTPTAVDAGDNTGRPSCVGYHFQVKVIVTGSCVVMGMNFFATTQPGTSIAPPVANDPPLTPKVA